MYRILCGFGVLAVLCELERGVAKCALCDLKLVVALCEVRCVAWSDKEFGGWLSLV